MNNIERFKNRIVNGNSLEILKTIPPDIIDLVITSPPYFGCRVYGNETLGREMHPLDYIKNIIEFTKEIKRVLNTKGSFYLNIGDVYFGSKGFSRNTGTWKRKTDYHYKEHKIAKEDGLYLQYKQLLLLPSRIAIEMQNDGWILRQDIIWNKLNPMPSHSPDRRLPIYEHIFHFVKSKKYYFNYEKAKELNNHRDIMECSPEPFKDHHATFPEKLIKPLILTTSKIEDIILDPFMGAGTVAVVCKKNQRNYIGIELIKENCDIAERRILEENIIKL